MVAVKSERLQEREGKGGASLVWMACSLPRAHPSQVEYDCDKKRL